jgi:hypothetical protein
MLFIRIFPTIIAAGLALSVVAVAAKDFRQDPKPPLRVPEKASEIGHRTVVKPGKPESHQPPADVVGTSMSDLNRARINSKTSPSMFHPARPLGHKSATTPLLAP